MQQKEKTIAEKRIKILFKEAGKIFKKDPKLADRYIKLARKIAMKIKVRIPRELKRKFCKHCYRFLKQGVTCRVRTKDKKVIYFCMNCEKYMRFPIKQKVIK
jgi:ribonuclease P protein subunit RPR2|tara:strand:- start:25558 stop:25863 length:306 start_codon:yes stop_codon:yes gene_type:complete